MTVVKTIADARAERAKLGKLALVPTMGALHRGHLSLVEYARQSAPFTAVSIFVNPTQFAPREDYTNYPRAIESDRGRCRDLRLSLVVNPSADGVYPPEP